MRILLSYKFHKNITPLGSECEQALEDLGHSVIRMDVDRKRPWWKATAKPDSSRDELFLKLVDEARPDLVFVVIGYNYLPQTLESIKKRYNTKLIGWHVENPEHYDGLYDTLPWYDHMFSFSRNVASEITARSGKTCSYVNYGTDCKLYKPLRLNWMDRLIYCSDISFLGKYKERRRDYLKELSGAGLSIWGPLWKKDLPGDRELLSCVKGYRLFGLKAAKLFNATKINVNINSWALPSGPNLRVFDVPASGAFLLTEYVEELEDLFTIGKEIDVFSSPEELRDKALFYLRHESLREDMAKKGYERVRTSYKMSDCVLRILKEIE